MRLNGNSGRVLRQQGPVTDVGYDLGVTGVLHAIQGFVKRAIFDLCALNLQIKNHLVN